MVENSYTFSSPTQWVLPRLPLCDEELQFQERGFPVAPTVPFPDPRCEFQASFFPSPLPDA